jgi:hypothetical protein
MAPAGVVTRAWLALSKFAWKVVHLLVSNRGLGSLVYPATETNVLSRANTGFGAQRKEAAPTLRPKLSRTMRLADRLPPHRIWCLTRSHTRRLVVAAETKEPKKGGAAAEEDN